MENVLKNFKGFVYFDRIFFETEFVPSRY